MRCARFLLLQDMFEFERGPLEYKDKLIRNVVLHYGTKMFMPLPIREGIAVVKSAKYVLPALH